jgi:hypothetical protein
MTSTTAAATQPLPTLPAYSEGPYIVQPIGGRTAFLICAANGAILTELTYRGDEIDQAANARLFGAAWSLVEAVREAVELDSRSDRFLRDLATGGLGPSSRRAANALALREALAEVDGRRAP